MHVDMELTKMIIIMFELAWLWVPCQDIGLGWPISVLQVDVNRFWVVPCQSLEFAYCWAFF